MRSIHIRAFTVSKSGSTEAENEDRLHRRPKHGLRIGMSDGATESGRAGQWAQVLVESSWKSTLLDKHGPDSGNLPDAVVAAWLQPVREQFTNLHAEQEQPWYSREKLKQGSHATFLALRVFPSGRWKAASCGDTCLMEVADGRVSSSWPVEQPAEFNNAPQLVSSRPDAPLPQVSVISRAELPEMLVLATDALAAWLLDEYRGSERLCRLVQCDSSEEFETFIVEERAGGAIRNDDTTVVLVST